MKTMYKNALLVIAAVITFAACSKNNVKSDSRFARPIESKLAIVVISQYGAELVEGDPQQMGDCLMYQTKINKTVVRRLLCDKYLITAYDNPKTMRKDIRNK
jgi:hypothetical protein